jgi:hypothetical protein
MTEPIWVQKSEERKEKVLELIQRLEKSSHEHAQALVLALNHYGIDNRNLPHQDWVKIRKELITKAEEFLSEQH